MLQLPHLLLIVTHITFHSNAIIKVHYERAKRTTFKPRMGFYADKHTSLLKNKQQVFISSYIHFHSKFH